MHWAASRAQPESDVPCAHVILPCMRHPPGTHRTLYNQPSKARVGISCPCSTNPPKTSISAACSMLPRFDADVLAGAMLSLQASECLSESTFAATSTSLCKSWWLLPAPGMTQAHASPEASAIGIGPNADGNFNEDLYKLLQEEEDFSAMQVRWGMPETPSERADRQRRAAKAQQQQPPWKRDRTPPSSTLVLQLLLLLATRMRACADSQLVGPAPKGLVPAAECSQLLRGASGSQGLGGRLSSSAPAAAGLAADTSGPAAFGGALVGALSSSTEWDELPVRLIRTLIHRPVSIGTMRSILSGRVLASKRACEGRHIVAGTVYALTHGRIISGCKQLYSITKGRMNDSVLSSKHSTCTVSIA